MDSAQEMAALGAQEVVQLPRDKPQAVLGLATGSTMTGFYAALARQFLSGAVSFREATSFNLDDYYPIDGTDPASYRYEMCKKLFEHLDISLTPIDGARWGQTFVPTCADKNSGAFCLRYEQEIIKAGGIDLQILGIGRNAHIGFNEPGASLWSRTRVVKLSDDTRDAQVVHFSSPERVPHCAISMGILTILEARRLTLMASGKAKADAIAETLLVPWNPQVPASALQFHPNVTFILDKEAAQHLRA